MEYEIKYFPKGSEKLLDKLLINLVELNDVRSETCLFSEFNQQYSSEIGIIKNPSQKLDFVNAIYEKLKEAKSRISKKERIIQKMEKQDLVDRLISENEFTINEFTWYINSYVVTYDQKELYINCLENYDNFKTAIEEGILKIVHGININNQFVQEVEPLNDVLKYKVKNGSVTYSSDDFGIEYIDDDTKTSIIADYLLAKALGNDTEYDEDYDDEEDEEENDSSFYIRADNLLVREYTNSLRRIAYRLLCVYAYMSNNNVDITNMNSEEFSNLLRVIHYYTLEDYSETLEIDDDYASEYEDLTSFYKTYIYNLGIALISAVRSMEKEDLKPEGMEEKQDIPYLTHKLILELKNRKNNE